MSNAARTEESTKPAAQTISHKFWVLISMYFTLAIRDSMRIVATLLPSPSGSPGFRTRSAKRSSGALLFVSRYYPEDT